MFEHSLIDLETKRQPRRRWISLPIAVGLHVVGLTAFAFASYWSVGNVPEPSRTNLVFFQLAPLPEIPGGGGGRPPQPPVNRPEHRDPTPPETRPVQPTEQSVPTEIPTPASTDVVDLPNSGLFPGDSTGPSSGDCPTCPVGPGYGHEDPSDTPSIGIGDSLPIHLTVGITKPEILKRVQPRYTDIARKAGVQGTVVVEATIDKQGNVTDARVLRGLPMGLNEEAVNAILQWRFMPAYQGSRPVSVYFTLTVNFTIQR
jgi:protein TonB